MKKCIKCRVDKPLTDYYRHKGMKDGRLGKCIYCVKEYAKKAHHYKSKDMDYVVKERKRGRERYHRLNYKNKSLERIAKCPWVANSKYKNLSRKYNIEKGYELHHWSYLDVYLEDVVIIDIKSHRRLHRLLTLDIERRIFIRKDNGVHLNTKEEHLSYIKENGFSYKRILK